MKRIIKFTVIFSILTAIFSPAIFAQDKSILSVAASVKSESEWKKMMEGLSTADTYYELYSGIALHNICRDNSELQKKAIEILENSYKHSSSPLALGYLGSVVTMQGGTASLNGNLITATTSLAKGISLIDEAISTQPDSVHLRFLRLFNSLDVSDSSPVSRMKEDESDIDWLSGHLNGVEKDEALLLLARGRLALARGEYDDAFTFLEKTIMTAPGSTAAAQADDLLWLLEE